MKRTPLSVHSRVWIIRLLWPLALGRWSIYFRLRAQSRIVGYRPTTNDRFQKLDSVLLAPTPRVIHHRRLSAQLASGADRREFVGLIGLQHVFPAHVLGFEDRHEWRRRRSLLDARPSASFFTLYQTHHAHHFESELARRLDRLHGGGARGADVVDDHDLGTLLAKAFNALSHAVLLLCLADKKPVPLAAGHGNRDHDRICAHGQAADGLRFPSALPDFFGEDLSGELRPARIERCGAAVDVVVAGAARRQLELAQSERLMRKKAQ